MNIFATYDCPVKSALALDDVRLNKMIIETAQMLSTVLRKELVFDDRLYKSAYERHPCTLWAGRTRGNFQWLCNHGLAMSIIYEVMYGKKHKSSEVISLCSSLVHKVPKGGLTEFADCTEFKDRTDIPVTERYKMFMNLKWSRDTITLKWTGRKVPSFYSKQP